MTPPAHSATTTPLGGGASGHTRAPTTSSHGPRVGSALDVATTSTSAKKKKGKTKTKGVEAARPPTRTVRVGKQPTGVATATTTTASSARSGIVSVAQKRPQSGAAALQAGAPTSGHAHGRKRKGDDGSRADTEGPSSTSAVKKAKKKKTKTKMGTLTGGACDPPTSNAAGAKPLGATAGVKSISGAALPAATQKKSAASDLDSMFGGLSAKKKKKEAAVVEASSKAAGLDKMSMDDSDGFFDSRGTKSKRTYTAEGFAVYTEDELKISVDAGNTDQCPFDCQCCF